VKAERDVFEYKNAGEAATSGNAVLVAEVFQIIAFGENSVLVPKTIAPSAALPKHRN